MIIKAQSSVNTILCTGEAEGSGAVRSNLEHLSLETFAMKEQEKLSTKCSF